MTSRHHKSADATCHRLASNNHPFAVPDAVLAQQFCGSTRVNQQIESDARVIIDGTIDRTS